MSDQASHLGMVFVGNDRVQRLVADVVWMVSPQCLGLVGDSGADQVHGEEHGRKRRATWGRVHFLRVLDLSGG